ncbi:MAG TPA: tyrosine-type recombinase/integrase [Pseudomonadota bacterium]|nr:tyrosine-type recombinase/integrase [Pseudomonadota bacterium]
MGDIVRVVRRGKFVGWYVRYKDTDGRRKQRASHQPTKELARRYLLEIEGRVARGVIGIPELGRPALTLADLCEHFLKEYTRPRLKDPAQYRSDARTCLRRVLPLIGDRAVDSLRPADLARARDELGKLYSAASVRVTLAFLGTVLSWAVKQSLLPLNPLKGVERPVAQPSVEYFSRDEVTALLTLGAQRAESGELADKLLYACAHFAVHTGLRKGELLGLRWQDLDLDTGRLTVARSYKTAPKSGKIRHLRLPAACAPVLRSWKSSCPATQDGLVFPVRRGGEHSHKAMLGLPRLLAAAGCRVPLHPWHALRHTFSSHFIMSGGSLLALQKILGHSDVKMTMIYAHLAPDFLGTEMDRIKF